MHRNSLFSISNYYLEAKEMLAQSKANERQNFRSSSYPIPSHQTVAKIVDKLNQIPTEQQTDEDRQLLLECYEMGGYIAVKMQHLNDHHFDIALTYRQKAVQLQREILLKNPTAFEKIKLAQLLHHLAIAYAKKSHTEEEKDLFLAKKAIDEAIHLMDENIENATKDDMKKLVSYHETACQIDLDRKKFPSAYHHHKLCLDYLIKLKLCFDRDNMSTYDDQIIHLKHEMKMKFRHNPQAAVAIADNFIGQKHELEKLRLRVEKLESDNELLKNKLLEEEKNHHENSNGFTNASLKLLPPVSSVSKKFSAVKQNIQKILKK